MTDKWNGYPADRNRSGQYLLHFRQYSDISPDVMYWSAGWQTWSAGSSETVAKRYTHAEALYTETELNAAVAAEREACAAECDLAGRAYLSRGVDHAVDISDSFKDMAFLIRGRSAP